MNWLHWFLLILAAVFVALLPLSRKLAMAYARYTVLILVGCVMLMPFAWLISAAFKDKDVLNEYMFLPPISKWSSETINNENFVELFKPKPTLQGDVSFWRYVSNSLFLASAGTFMNLFFSSLGGYALAKYRFRGRA